MRDELLLSICFLFPSYFSSVFSGFQMLYTTLYAMMFATDPFNSNENVHHDNEARRENYAFMLHVFVYIYKRYYFSELYVTLLLYTKYRVF